MRAVVLGVSHGVWVGAAAALVASAAPGTLVAVAGVVAVGFRFSDVHFVAACAFVVEVPLFCAQSCFGDLGGEGGRGREREELTMLCAL